MRFRPSHPALTVLLALFVACTGLLSPVTMASVETKKDNQTRNTDPEKTLEEMYWGTLYADGGETLFCKVPFSKKTVKIREAYYYDTDSMRAALDCGTSGKCRTNSPEYRRMISDMHNMFPATMEFTLDRKAARFADLNRKVEENECGLRVGDGQIEPPDALKGRVARAILYMVNSYKLPLLTKLETLTDWSRRFPPDDEEIALNTAIAKLQGNRNTFIDDQKKTEKMR